MPATPSNYSRKELIQQPVDIFGVQVCSPKINAVQVGEVFTVKWGVMNLGTCPWINRVLECRENSILSALKIAHKTILIPDTPVGGRAVISVLFKAPNYPCVATSAWQLADSDSQYFDTLYCHVDVLTDRLPVAS